VSFIRSPPPGHVHVAASRYRPYMEKTWSGSAFAIMIAAWAVLGAVDTLVWMPQTLAPTTSLPDAYAAMADIGDVPWVVPWPLLCAVVGLAVAALVARRPSRSGSTPNRLGIALLAVGVLTFAWAWSALPMGLWLSDHLPPYEGGLSLFGGLATWVGTAAAVVGAVLVVVAWARGASRGDRRVTPVSRRG
jgi:hypothetical protein